MIPESKVEQIEQCLDEGHMTRREIARCVGVSRDTVARVANRRRRFRPAAQRPRPKVQPPPLLNTADNERIGRGKVEAIQRALAADLPHRDIARYLGVGLSIVKRVARGEPVGEKTPESARCPDCGAMVIMPCWACYIRSLVKTPGRRREGSPILGLELKPEDYERYLQVRRRREATEGVTG